MITSECTHTANCQKYTNKCRLVLYSGPMFKKKKKTVALGRGDKNKDTETVKTCTALCLSTTGRAGWCMNRSFGKKK